MAGDGDDEETLLDEPVTVANLAELRGHVLGLARLAGLPEERAQDFVLAVYEAVTNAVKHVGGGGHLAVVRDDQRRLIADVHDAGPGMPYSVTITLPPPTAAGGRGLWLASSLVDHSTSAARRRVRRCAWRCPSRRTDRQSSPVSVRCRATSRSLVLVAWLARTSSTNAWSAVSR
ncbi:hypothetical protein GCM10009557_14070 [Virgisporangium ochraceum]